MTRPTRLVILATANCLFWLAMFVLTWHHLIPERVIFGTFLLSQLFAWPLAVTCVSMWFLINAQFHDTGWRLALTGGIMVLNSALWAWCVDWLWQKAPRRRREDRGFRVVPVEPARESRE